MITWVIPVEGNSNSRGGKYTCASSIWYDRLPAGDGLSLGSLRESPGWVVNNAAAGFHSCTTSSHLAMCLSRSVYWLDFIFYSLRVIVQWSSHSSTRSSDERSNQTIAGRLVAPRLPSMQSLHDDEPSPCEELVLAGFVAGVAGMRKKEACATRSTTAIRTTSARLL